MHSKSNNVRKAVIAFVAFCAALLLSSFLAAGIFSRAEEQSPTNDGAAKVIKHSSDTKYFYFDYPTAIYADGNGFTVADGAQAYAFDNSGAATALNGVFSGASFNNTEKFAPAGDLCVMLSNGELFAGNRSLGNYSDFTVLDGKLYAVHAATESIHEYALSALGVPAPDEDAETVSETVDRKEHYVAGRPLKITNDGKRIYLSVANRHLNDVFCFIPTESDLGTPAECIAATQEILSMCGKHDGGIVCLTRTGITSYSYENGRLFEKNTLTAYDTVSIAVSGNTVYGITDLNSVYKTENDFSNRTVILASAHDELGFYNANSGVASRKDFIAVADERNNRIQVLRNDGTHEIPNVVRPKAVAIDYTGNIYVAHSVGKISVYDGNTLLLKRQLDSEAPGQSLITDLKIDTNNNLYVLCSNRQLYRIKASADKTGSDEFVSIGTNVNTALTIAQLDDKIYVATTDNTIDSLDAEGNRNIEFSFGKDLHLKDFCTDHSNSFYLLFSDGKIRKFKDGKQTTVYENAGLIGAEKIVMNSVKLDKLGLEYGSLLFSDTAAHALKGLSGNNLGVNEGFQISDEMPSFEQENIDPDKLDEVSNSNDGIIFEVSDCYVYPRPAELNGLVFLPNGYKVIIPRFNPDEKFNFVIADCVEKISDKPIRGYVYTSLIKQQKPLEYGEPPASSCYPYKDGVGIYKYPSLDLNAAASLDRNTSLTLLAFVYTDSTYGYRDNYSNHKAQWYRVKYTDETLGEREGYITGDFISFFGETPDSRAVLPRYNATVVSKYGTAPHDKNAEGEFVPFAVLKPEFALQNLEKGARVEVVGSFDSSKEFTLVRYYCGEVDGTIEFYVKTDDLKYDGVNKVVVIAIVIIILTVILGAILIARMVYVKRTRRLNETKL